MAMNWYGGVDWAWALLRAAPTLPSRRAVPPDPAGVAKQGLNAPRPAPARSGSRSAWQVWGRPRRPTPAAEVPGTAARAANVVLAVVEIETCLPEQRIGPAVAARGSPGRCSGRNSTCSGSLRRGLIGAGSSHAPPNSAPGGHECLQRTAISRSQNTIGNRRATSTNGLDGTSSGTGCDGPGSGRDALPRVAGTGQRRCRA